MPLIPGGWRRERIVAQRAHDPFAILKREDADWTDYSPFHEPGQPGTLDSDGISDHARES